MVTKAGSLGLLAVGDAGLLASRRRMQALVHLADLANKPRRQKSNSRRPKIWLAFAQRIAQSF
ncbi:MAG: hypothetical protein DMF70_14935 [Acidobacteria bacterium]|nr:MAG: hypothetical protein DMF70_14935 [Acidobacteriota bacterium]